MASKLDALGPQQLLDTADAAKVVLAHLGYCLRATSRPTPFGLFAGVAEASFGSAATVRWGSEHQTVARADGRWLTAIITELENIAPVRRMLRVVANNVLELRGERVVVPWRPRKPGAAGTAVQEVSLRWTSEVRAAVEMTATPVPYEDVVRKLATELPLLDGPAAAELLDTLLVHRVLISNLQPPATETDALGYLLAQLRRSGADRVPDVAELVDELHHIHSLMEEHNQQPAAATGTHHRRLAERMAIRWQVSEPLAVDLRLDAEVILPRQAAWEAERVVAALAQISPDSYVPPTGSVPFLNMCRPTPESPPATPTTCRPAGPYRRMPAPPASTGLRMCSIGRGCGRVGGWCGAFELLVSSPRRIEPCMRFSRTRLSGILHHRCSAGARQDRKGLGRRQLR